MNPWLFAVVGFVGINMLQSAFSGFCPLAVVPREACVPESACRTRPMATSQRAKPGDALSKLR